MRLAFYDRYLLIIDGVAGISFTFVLFDLIFWILQILDRREGEMDMKVVEWLVLWDRTDGWQHPIRDSLVMVHYHGTLTEV